MKKFFSLLCLTAVMSMLFCACRLIRIEEEKPAPLEYTVINQENIPKEAEKLIEHIEFRDQCGQLKQLDSMTNSEIRVLKFFIA